MRCHFDHKVVAADPGGEREDNVGRVWESQIPDHAWPQHITSHAYVRMGTQELAASSSRLD